MLRSFVCICEVFEALRQNGRHHRLPCDFPLDPLIISSIRPKITTNNQFLINFSTILSTMRWFLKDTFGAPLYSRRSTRNASLMALRSSALLPPFCFKMLTIYSTCFRSDDPVKLSAKLSIHDAIISQHCHFQRGTRNSSPQLKQLGLVKPWIFI